MTYLMSYDYSLVLNDNLKSRNGPRSDGPLKKFGVLMIYLLFASNPQTFNSVLPVA